MESKHFGPNVISFQLVMGKRRWYIVEYYLAPDGTLTTEIVVAALKERPRGAKLLVVGDFNINLAEPEVYRRGEDIALAMVREELEDMLAHFLLCRRSW